MKVVVNALRYASNSAGGGNKTYANTIIRALAEMDSDIEWIILAADDNREYFSRQDGRLEVRSFPLPSKMSARIPKEHWITSRVLHKIKPDLLFSANTQLPAGPVPCFSVTVIHEIIFTHISQGFFKDAYRRWLFSQSCRRATRIIAVSDFNRKDLERKFPASIGKTSVVHHGVDHSMFYPAESEEEKAEIRHRLELPERFLFSIGHYNHKNIPALIKAFAESGLPSEGGPILVVAGLRDTYMEECVETAQRMRVSRRVKLLPYLPIKKCALFYRAAELFVFPSLFEGFGMPVLEAMASGCPVLSSNRTSLPEVGGDAAEYFEPADESGFAEKLNSLACDTDKKQKLTSLGIERAAEFTWKRAAEQTFEVIKQAAGK